MVITEEKMSEKMTRIGLTSFQQKIVETCDERIAVTNPAQVQEKARLLYLLM